MLDYILFKKKKDRKNIYGQMFASSHLSQHMIQFNHTELYTFYNISKHFIVFAIIFILWFMINKLLTYLWQNKVQAFYGLVVLCFFLNNLFKKYDYLPNKTSVKILFLLFSLVYNIYFAGTNLSWINVFLWSPLHFFLQYYMKLEISF